MLKLEPNTEKAQEAFARGFGLALIRFHELYGYIAELEKVAEGLKAMMRSEASGLWSAVRRGDFNQYVDREALDRLGEMKFREIEEQSAQQRYKRHQRIAQGAALALAHAMVDEVLNHACWASVYANPSHWLKDIGSQKLGVTSVVERSIESLVIDAIHAKAKSYERLSVACKTERLLKVCGAHIRAAATDGFELDHERMAEIDRRRHDMLHSLSRADPLPGGLGDLEFMQRTALTMICAIALTYGLKANSEDTWRHGVGLDVPPGVDLNAFVGTVSPSSSGYA